MGVRVGEDGVPALAEERGLDLAVGLEEALPVVRAVPLAVAGAEALGALLGVVEVTGAASRAAHSVSWVERLETMFCASLRLVAVIEESTLDCCGIGSPATVTGSEL